MGLRIQWLIGGVDRAAEVDEGQSEDKPAGLLICMGL